MRPSRRRASAVNEEDIVDVDEAPARTQRSLARSSLSGRSGRDTTAAEREAVGGDDEVAVVGGAQPANESSSESEDETERNVPVIRLADQEERVRRVVESMDQNVNTIRFVLF